MNFKLDMQLFASVGSAVVGHRIYMSTSTVIPTDLTKGLIGFRSTPDLGEAQNTVEANVINSIKEENVQGLYPAAEVEYTLLLASETIKQQLAFINKETWVYEERQDMTSDPTKLGNGIVYKVKLSGLIPTGQEPEGLQEMTQSGVMVSDETYWVEVTYTDSTPSYTITGLQTGTATTETKLTGGSLS
jgi:hypothetical protein